ncbi:uncharacterized protein LOC117338858 [Pecten maximus]|uniref:uncharacterized protein LOC117338858 n=1 Tax=Pecten maximus TaxID=6579 RepID=UPI001458921B|nr:uncharacterized protein LOC117338858 [Pecten maximus]
MEIDDAEDDDRKRALLLHYVGERVYDIYLAEKTPTTGTSYADTKKVLEDDFRPRKDTQMEIYKFTSCKQKEGQTLDEYVAELRTLARDCDFKDLNKEILSQLIQHCRSNQLRRRALREPGKGLEDIIKLEFVEEEIPWPSVSSQASPERKSSDVSRSSQGQKPNMSPQAAKARTDNGQGQVRGQNRRSTRGKKPHSRFKVYVLY